MDVQLVLLTIGTLFYLICLTYGIPLQDDTVSFRRLQPGCRLGSHFYDLHATWTPNLEPHGPMYCIVCKCNPVMKKGVLQSAGKVTCKNIRNSCPNTERCSSPIPAEGRCCKLCPGQAFDPARAFDSVDAKVIKGEMMMLSEQEIAENNINEYTALLTGNPKVTSSNTSAVARGRFSLNSGSLHYSMVINGLKSPKIIQFVDGIGNILHEDEIRKRNDMICGTWTSLTKTNMRYLQQQGVHVTLHSTNKDMHISGRILPHTAPEKETFSALLRDNDSTGSGGAAILNYDVKQKTLSITVSLKGVQLPMDTPSPVSLELFKGKKRVGFTRVEVLGHESELTGSWHRPLRKVLKNLPRSRLTLLVTMVTGKKLQGTINPRRTCNGFQALLSGQLRRNKVLSGAAGFAVFDLTKEGRLDYKVQLEGLKSPLTELVLATPKRRRGKNRPVCQIDLPQNSTQNSFKLSGTCKRIRFTDVTKFLQGVLEVRVSTTRYPDGLLRGPLVETLHNPQINQKVSPALLSGSALTPPTETFTAGRLWISVDYLCVLHYDVMISGIDSSKDSLLRVTLDAVGRKSAEQIVLGDFHGSMGRGIVTNVQRRMFASLHKGAVMVTVRTKAHPTGIIGTKAHLLNSCHGSKSKGNFVNVGILQDNAITEDTELKTRCSYDGKWFSDGDSWPRSSGHNCGMCSCKRGQVECHDGICPTVDCDNPVLPPGECCPQCFDDSLSNSGSCYYEGDQSYHRYGTVWHPYIPLLGYSTCAVCKCGEAGSDNVNCTRLNCPKLDCPLQEAVRINPTDCCQVCPAKPSTTPVPRAATLAPIKGHEMPMENDNSCASHGIKYSHGQRWHPRIQPFGFLPCYTCLCQNGEIGCARTICPELTCTKKIIKSGECCPQCQ